jgi:hypothetical protein
MRIAFTRELLCCGLAIKDDNLMRSSKSAALIVAIVVVLFFATLFGFRAYSRHEAARIAQELELAEEAKVMHQFEALVSEDTARTELTWANILQSPVSTGRNIRFELSKDVDNREKIIVQTKVLPQTFSPDLRKGFVDLLSAENELARAMTNMDEEEHKYSIFQDQYAHPWSPTSISAHVLLTALNSAIASEKSFQSLTSGKSVAYTPVLSPLQPKIQRSVDGYLLMTISLSSPNITYPQSARTLQTLNFKDMAYQLEGTTALMRDGTFSQRENYSSYSAKLDNIWYLEGSDATRQHALISIEATGCGGSCSSTGYLFLFELKDKHPVVVEQLEFDDHAYGAGASFNANSGLLVVKSKSEDGSPNCCAQRLDVISYKWNGHFEEIERRVEAAPEQPKK